MQRGDRRTRPQSLQTEARVRTGWAVHEAWGLRAGPQEEDPHPSSHKAHMQLAARLPKETHDGPTGTNGVAQGPGGAGGRKHPYSPFPEQRLLWGRPPALRGAVRPTRRA